METRVRLAINPSLFPPFTTINHYVTILPPIPHFATTISKKTPPKSIKTSFKDSKLGKALKKRQKPVKDTSWQLKDYDN